MTYGQASIPVRPQEQSGTSQSSMPDPCSHELPQSNLRRVPEQNERKESAALLGRVRSPAKIVLPDVQVELIPVEAGAPASGKSDRDGIIRITRIVPGTYQVTFRSPNFKCLAQPVKFNAGEAVVAEVILDPEVNPDPNARQIPEQGGTPTYASSGWQEILRPPIPEIMEELHLVPSKVYMAPDPDRWNPDPNPDRDLPRGMPEWARYERRKGEFPYAPRNHWWDPFNINRLKGDKPIMGQNVFFNFTGTSTTALDVRRLFVPSGVSAANPGNSQFFGRSAQVFLEETVRASFDLFKGDTSFKPVDWRVRLTPAFNVNQLWAREQGIVNIDVREGTSRNDGHVGLQEAFVEKKIHDLSPNYDFVSIRVGIQQFSSDFRGLLFSQEQPGVRVFGNLQSNRLQYNAAYFFFLEKDTNSGLNTLNSRHQQVAIANFYWQDFLFKGYTTQFSYHFNKDDASRHFDENGFLVRPAPIGNVQPHSVKAHYIGWTSNGHIGRVNVSHAFYQALGHESINLFDPNRKRDYINAQLAALELSVDYDWVRLHTSGFFASGDNKPNDGFARGFDSISESQSFAGGIFSFFNREGIRLTGTGVALVAPDSFLPNLRSSKEEGQSNFVNPGILLVNAGADFNLTTTLRAVTNVNYMRFNHPESLQLLLFQSHIDESIGTDYSVGVVYRPKLSENIVVTSGVAALTPGLGLRQIYTSKTLVSGFTTVRFKF
ncbi:MAG TPA: carboxypeptidase-like regulatory domain-containing protein [Candidatus Angelobacter sp.]|nr:carboxypeptidase-like regulatory domain-containing protein [Candidatus Angelobacter sp.]